MEDINKVFVDPENPDIDYAALDFDQQLKYTQGIKGRVLHKLVSTPGGMPNDKDSVELILKVADSMDKTAIAKKRISVDEKQSDAAVSILQAIVQSIHVGGGVNPFLRSETAEPMESQDIGALPDYSNKHAAGEGEIGVITETSENFTKRMDIVNREALAKRAEEMGLTDDDIPVETP